MFYATIPCNKIGTLHSCTPDYRRSLADKEGNNNISKVSFENMGIKREFYSVELCQ